MAQSDGGTKSQAVRDYLTDRPGAGPKEVVAKLAERGVTVSAQLVSVVKRKLKGGKGRKQKRVVRKPQRAAQAVASSSSAANGLSVSDLVETNKLVNQLGGVKNVRAALDALERLQG